MWILDEPDQIPERIGDRRDLDPFADVLDRRRECCASARELLDRLGSVRNAPVGHNPARSGFDAFRVRVESKLVTADVEADIERFIEIGLDAEGAAVPLLGARKIRDIIDRRAQSENGHSGILARHPAYDERKRSGCWYVSRRHIHSTGPN